MYMHEFPAVKATPLYFISVYTYVHEFLVVKAVFSHNLHILVDGNVVVEF